MEKQRCSMPGMTFLNAWLTTRPTPTYEDDGLPIWLITRRSVGRIGKMNEIEIFQQLWVVDRVQRHE